MKALNKLLHIFNILILLFICQEIKAQINLVPNGDFELIDTCPNGFRQIYFASPWFQPVRNSTHTVIQSSSTEYFNSCSPSLPLLVSNPKNYAGYQYPHSGNGYIGFGFYSPSGIPGIYPNIREYAEIKLSEPLIAGSKYRIEYYIVLSNSSKYAVNRFDAFLSVDSLLDSTNYTVINVNPQLSYSGFITDTLNWQKISGSFTSIGGEIFLTIGNFHSDTLTDTLHIINSSSFFASNSYYYIDDVSLTLDSTTSIGELNNKNHFAIAPNPGKDLFTISYAIPKKSVFVIYDILGVPLYQKELDEGANSISINLSFLKPGCYYYSLLCDSKIIESNKLVILK